MALANIAGWNGNTAGSACGAGDEKKPAACGSACGAGDKEKPAACGSACGAGEK